ncbi:MAG: thioredoxin domain-containing protein [Chthoniobacterales bacterium]
MNHLANSSSPYLLQHASNPVEWYPWGEEAFTQARLEQKPIFLSIGYSTCHWCHVMAHESFENEMIAALLNEHFICIKVDREERPDIDRLYMSYVQAFTGGGGWPMSVWLTPTLKPFFGGTYFPPQNAYGRLGFPSVLLQLAQLWKEKREQVEQESIRTMRLLEQVAKKELALFSIEKELPLQRAFEEFSESFDETWGGFGAAPKFPRPSVLFFLLRYAHTHDDENGRHARKMALLTLCKMAAGGMYDHLGGGFHRYAVDRIWQVPHFEKMLYDQAQLVMAYLEAYQLTEGQEYANVVQSILSYVQREMTSPDGGFYAAEDADSLNESGVKSEGAFYVWSEKEIRELLSEKECQLVVRRYCVKKTGNVPAQYDPHAELTEKNIFIVLEDKKLSRVDEKSLSRAREKLFQARAKRPRPHRDDKIVTAWNGLMISAFARTGAILGFQHYVDTAIHAALFIRKNLYDSSSGELRHSWCLGHSSEHGFAEDYAFLIQGLLDLYEATFDVAWLQWAKILQKKMDHLFWDGAQGGYFTSATGDPHLLMRMKEEYDGAEPSANSVAALNHLRFSRMLDDASATEKATAIFNASALTLEGMPTAVPQLLVALWYSLTPLRQLVVAGELAWPDTQALLAQARKEFHPEQVIMLAEGEVGHEWLAERKVELSEMKSIEGKAVLYRCENFCCEKVLL